MEVLRSPNEPENIGVRPSRGVSWQAPDSALNDIARLLNDVEIVGALDPAEEASCSERVASEGGARCVGMFPDLRHWVVRYYLCGHYRNMGIINARQQNVTVACRFADLVQWHFWKYRIRRACPPVESSLNFSLARVQEDYQVEVGMFEILEMLEKHFLSNGVIMPRAALEEKRKKDRTASSMQRTRHSEFAAYCASLTDTVSGLAVEIKKLSAQISELKNK